MGLSVVVDSECEKAISQLFAAGQAVKTGLIIGAVTDKRHMVLKLVPTPSAGEEAADASPMQGVDAGWAGIHAAQVTRALPGGVEVLGAYMLCRGDATATVRKLTFAPTPTPPRTTPDRPRAGSRRARRRRWRMAGRSRARGSGWRCTLARGGG